MSDNIHLAMALVGGAIVFGISVSRLSPGPTIAMPSAALMAGGILIGLVLPRFGSELDPVTDPRPWELAAEVCVIISLFATGLQIDRTNRPTWWRTATLLAIGMPLTIAALLWAGHALVGLPFATALLLGAVLAPTDPVLAGDVQVGGPHKGNEGPVRFTLTTEAGLNDGLAFPFVWLAIVTAAAGGLDASLLLDWAMDDLLKKIVIGSLAGAALGWLMGQALFRWPTKVEVSPVTADVVILGAVFFVYGTTELVGGYGFIAAFVGGLMVRSAAQHDRAHTKLFAFAESLERALTALLLVAGGVALGLMLPYLSLGILGVALLLLFVIRPLAGLLALAPIRMPMKERAIIALFGVRGIGSLYYLAFAASEAPFANMASVWAIVLLTMFGSTLIHGLTAGPIMARLEKTGFR